MTRTNTANEYPTLPFTGERFTPECVREIWYEHWHRYAFALPLANGRRVLDAACGEGYGSALLAQSASTVVGVDVDLTTIEHARQRYKSAERLDFVCASVSDLPLPDRSVDLVVSFETIEHLHEQAEMLDEFHRVLDDHGILLLSSPDRATYNAEGGEPNPFHVRELSRNELSELLRHRFPAVHLLGQRLGFHSLLWALEAHAGTNGHWMRLDTDRGELHTGPDQRPVYYLAVCAKHAAALPELPALSVFSDVQASVYAHYHHEVRRLIQADLRIHQMQRELTELRARLAAQEGK